MKILVLNCGSSSVKYQLWDTEGDGVLAKGMVQRIGIENPLLEHKRPDEDKIKIEPGGIIDHTKAIELIIEAVIDENYGVIGDISEIEAVGHRLVHGAEEFAGSTIVTDEALAAMKRCIPLAPLHNPANIKGIEACLSELPGVPQAGIFDTAFHQTMPKFSYLYGLPIELYEKHKIRRYGFHGTSHYYVANKAAELMGRPIEELKLITAHLGNGASIAAVDGGKSLDTSMGMTPLEGLMMGTRSGDMDPYVPLFIQMHEGLTPEETSNLLNKKSGVLGITGKYTDMRDVLEAEKTGDEAAILAIDMYCYRVKKYIGAYSAAMGGLDALVFTAGVGENSDEIRAKIVDGLSFMGIEIDAKLNYDAWGILLDISSPHATVRTICVPTDEEFVIAKETERLVNAL
ncbi:MAG TPA: acetate kinase [candidate division Zixibacteria bacterium]|nr:acetate kinase [candidate division Zixibacteria bacterium]